MIYLVKFVAWLMFAGGMAASVGAAQYVSSIDLKAAFLLTISAAGLFTMHQYIMEEYE